MSAKTGWERSYQALTDLATNNSSGFSAFPEGNRVLHMIILNSPLYIDASCNFYGMEATWWTVSESNGTISKLNLWLTPPSMNENPSIESETFKTHGFSVRCIKD
jgi:uncharacterized protein (TIGR02145 family)